MEKKEYGDRCDVCNFSEEEWIDLNNSKTSGNLYLRKQLEKLRVLHKNNHSFGIAGFIKIPMDKTKPIEVITKRGHFRTTKELVSSTL